MNVLDILKRRDRSLVTNRPEDTVETAATLMSSHNIGALPVRDGNGRLVGVISERDIVRAFASKGGKVLTLRVQDLMTRDVVTCTPEDTVKRARQLMSQRHIRHLPVVDGDTLCGMISSRDVMECHLEQTELEVNVLRDYAIAR
ncbi:MAG: CBS domain-containing protein [Rhodobacterales bacterium]|nr:CBS domain-containing protein [Rhodobacterales bacterium]